MVEQNKKFKEAKSGNVYKFEKEGDSISGTLISWEESRTYPNSYAVKVRNPSQEQPIVVFVSGIVIDLFKSNNIQAGMDVMIEYKGKKTSTKSGMEYNDYKVYFA
jgi:hypothetical protein